MRTDDASAENGGLRACSVGTCVGAFRDENPFTFESKYLLVVVRYQNPVRLLLLAIGTLLARAGLVRREHVVRTTDLSWPRIVTGLARMSKSAVDVAMVGIAVGEVAIAGVGFATPFWGIAFSLGGGFAAGSIALVSQGFGADAHHQIGQAVRSSVFIVVALTVPVAVAFAAFPLELVSLIANEPQTAQAGARYLGIVAFGVPFAGLNLVGSRVFIGADDAWTPMIVRAGGAVINIGLNAVFIFGLDMGVAGAALGTVVANVAVTTVFVLALTAGRIPGLGAIPVQVDPFDTYIDRETVRDVFEIGLPVVGRNSVWTVAKFPMLAIVALFGPSVVAAYVIARRIFGLMNTPGWGFALAASSLVGQELGEGDEADAEAYANDIFVFSLGVYALFAVFVAAFAQPIVEVFVNADADPNTVPTAVGLTYAACVAVLAQSVKGTAAGPLDASGDTNWTFYSQVIGMVGFAIPLAYAGAVVPTIGIVGLYLSFVGEALVPAVINFWRYRTGKWKTISQAYRPESPVADD
jgi:putative MATE family efflux protein